MKNLLFLFFTITICLFYSCKTVDFEEELEQVENGVSIDVYSDKEPEIKEIIKFVDSPEIITTEVSTELIEESRVVLEGVEAVNKNYEDKIVIPEYKEGRLKGWLYREGSLYQVYCQTYRSTLIELEPGETILEVPFISEPDVWRIAHGVGNKNGLPTEYLIVKPDLSELVSTLIILTNKRVYQMELISSHTQYMPNVKWIYENDILLNTLQDRTVAQPTTEVTRGEFISFDYKMSHSVFKKPVWMPERVYDDGIKTYIVLNENALLIEYPGCFNDKNDIINYRTNKNIIIIDQLIEKITLKLGNEKVTIEKKKS